MTSTLHPHRPAGVVRASLCLHEVEAWLGEVRPVLRALQSGGSTGSLGQRRWLAEQVRIADEAIDLLDCESFEAEASGIPCEELHWLHTQVCALLDALHRVERAGAAAA